MTATLTLVAIIALFIYLLGIQVSWASGASITSMAIKLRRNYPELYSKSEAAQRAGKGRKMMRQAALWPVHMIQSLLSVIREADNLISENKRNTKD